MCSAVGRLGGSGEKCAERWVGWGEVCRGG